MTTLIWCEITIADTGQGIAREDRDKIFNPFFTTKTGGTGLGLAIVYRIIEDHRGTITVDSVPGKGTQFIIRLPISEEPVYATHQERYAGRRRRGGIDMSKILVVDDEQSMRDFLAIMLTKEGHEVVTAKNGADAIKAVQAEIFDLVITDVKMPGADGIDVLKSVKEISPETVVIMITAFATTETAVEAMKIGAYDYIIKPFKVDELKLIIYNSLEKRYLRKENILLKREIESKAGFANFIGKSEPMQKVFSLIRQVADTTSTVLITGESGTGKELVAKAVHFNSPRKNGPFVTVNCGALPETLLESELFGYMKGAFTGASSNKQGLFEAANDGTIFLDEISATTPALQIKLLRVLQEREFIRVGGTAESQG